MFQISHNYITSHSSRKGLFYKKTFPSKAAKLISPQNKKKTMPRKWRNRDPSLEIRRQIAFFSLPPPLASVTVEVIISQGLLVVVFSGRGGHWSMDIPRDGATHGGFPHKKSRKDRIYCSRKRNRREICQIGCCSPCIACLAANPKRGVFRLSRPLSCFFIFRVYAYGKLRAVPTGKKRGGGCCKNKNAVFICLYAPDRPNGIYAQHWTPHAIFPPILILFSACIVYVQTYSIK